MNFKEYFQPIDIFLTEEPKLFSRALGKVDPSIADPRTGKPYRKHDRLRQIKAIYEKAVSNNVKTEDLWGSFSCVQRLGPKYTALDGGTPLGLYAFPLKYIIDNNVTEVPMAGDRKYLHVFKIINDENYISMKPGKEEVEEIHDIDDIQKNAKELINSYISRHLSLKISLLRKTIKEELSKTGTEDLYSNDLIVNFYQMTVGNVQRQLTYSTSSNFDIKKYAQERIEKLSSREHFEKIISGALFATKTLMHRYSIYSHDLANVDIGSYPSEIKLFNNIDFENNNFELSEEIRNFANKMLKAVDSLSSMDRSMLEMLGNDKITLIELMKISRRLSNYILSDYVSIIATNFHTYLESYFLLSNKKIIKLFDHWTRRVGKLGDNVKKRKKEIIETIQVPFGKELRDFCEKNDLDWSQALFHTLKKTNSSTDEYGHYNKKNISGKFVYLITKKISSMLNEATIRKTGERSRPWVLWTNLLRKLGIEGLLDAQGTGTIYPSEPTQGVFFTTKNIELISTVVINKNGCGQESDSNVYDDSWDDASSTFRADSTPKERWFKSLSRNFEKLLYNISEKFERKLNNFFVLSSSLVRETKKLSEEEYNTFYDHGIFNKATMQYILANLQNALDREYVNTVAGLKSTEKLKPQITKAIEFINQLFDSGIYDGDYSKIDFSKITVSAREGVSNYQTGVFSSSKRFIKILSNIQRKIRVISQVYVHPTKRAREINDIIDGFKQTMIDLESLDIKLSNKFDLDPSWHKSMEYKTIKNSTDIILQYIWNLEEYFDHQPEFSKILLKIKEIKNCVKNDKFWCYQVKKIK